jgi:hypothetical protein
MQRYRARRINNQRASSATHNGTITFAA